MNPLTQEQIFQWFRTASIDQAESTALAAREIVVTRREHVIEPARKLGRPRGSRNKPKAAQEIASA